MLLETPGWRKPLARRSGCARQEAPERFAPRSPLSPRGRLWGRSGLCPAGDGGGSHQPGGVHSTAGPPPRRLEGVSRDGCGCPSGGDLRGWRGMVRHGRRTVSAASAFLDRWERGRYRGQPSMDRPLPAGGPVCRGSVKLRCSPQGASSTACTRSPASAIAAARASTKTFARATKSPSTSLIIGVNAPTALTWTPASVARPGKTGS